jgi:hypothetical protein
MTAQRGQSMTEFAVGAAALSLLLLGSITIAGFQEVQRRTSVAARQAAFESAWVGTRSDRTTHVRDVVASHLEEEGLTNAVGSGQYVRRSDITATAALRAAPGLAHDAGRAMVLPLRVAGGFLGGDFDLEPGGMFGGTVAVNIEPRSDLPQPFNVMTVQLRQPFGLMTDAWNAGSPDHVRRRASGLVPASTLTGLQTLWRPLLAPLSLVEPSLSRLCMGLIEPDRVPEDRLGAGRTPLPGRCP